MGTPRPWGSATLGTATAAGGTEGVREGGQHPDRETQGACGGKGDKTRVKERGEGQRKEKTMSDYKS